MRSRAGGLQRTSCSAGVLFGRILPKGRSASWRPLRLCWSASCVSKWHEMRLTGSQWRSSVAAKMCFSYGSPLSATVTSSWERLRLRSRNAHCWPTSRRRAASGRHGAGQCWRRNTAQNRPSSAQDTRWSERLGPSWASPAEGRPIAQFRQRQAKKEVRRFAVRT